MLLRYLVSKAVALAPRGQRSLHTVKSETPGLSQEERLKQLALAAGHKLHSHEKCVLCNTRLPTARSFALCEVILHMRCVGAVSVCYSGLQLFLTDKSSDSYEFGKLKPMQLTVWQPIMGLT